MIPLLRILIPTPLAVLLMLVTLAVIGTICRSSSMTISPGSGAPERSEFSIGIGGPIQITTVGESRSWQISWPLLLLQLVAIYLASNRVAIDLVRVTRLHRPATTYGIVGVSLVAITFLSAISVSKAYWGYWFSPPKLLPEASLIAAVKAVAAFKTQQDAAGKPVAVSDFTYSMASLVAAGRKYGSEASEERILVALEDRKLLPDDFSTNMALLPELYGLVSPTAELVKSTAGYDSSADLHGIVVEATDKEGNRCLLAGFRGGQLSNDHYPYYELFFQQEQGTRTWRLIHHQHYFYDAAGLEGFEWPVIWLLLSIVFVPLGMVAFTVARLIIRKRNASQE